MTALQWSSMLEINCKRALVAVVQRHVPYEQKDMGFQCCRKARTALPHTAEQLTLLLGFHCKQASC